MELKHRPALWPGHVEPHFGQDGQGRLGRRIRTDAPIPILGRLWHLPTAQLLQVGGGEAAVLSSDNDFVEILRGSKAAGAIVPTAVVF